MYAVYTCEQCFTEYDDEDKFVQCRGDACQEEVCKDCATKCKNPSCNRFICENCKYGSLKAGYCIDHAVWDEDWEPIDYIEKGQTFLEALRELGLTSMVPCDGNGLPCDEKVEVQTASLKLGRVTPRCASCSKEYKEDPDAFK